MSTEKKLLVVFGATGYQGGSVVRAFLNHPNYHVRALTRNTTSASAQELASLGAEVTAADLDDPTSLKAAFKDASIIYLVTSPFSPNNTSPEYTQATQALTIAASLPTLSHLIWSGLPSLTEISGGKYNRVFQYESKAAVTKYIEREQPELWKKTTVLWLGTYCQIWYQFPEIFGMVREGEGEGNQWVVRQSIGRETVMPMFDVRETGRVVQAILERKEELGGRIVSAVADVSKTQGEGFEAWGKLTGQRVRYDELTREEHEKYLQSLGLSEVMVDSCADISLAYREFQGKIMHGEGLIQAAELLPEGERLKTWDEFLEGEDWEAFLKK